MDDTISKFGDTIFVGGFINSLIYVLSIAFIFFLISKFLAHIMRKRNVDNRKSISNILHGVFVIVLVFTILSQLIMFQGFARTLLASSGIIAIVVGVAAQDTIGNFVSGVSIISFKPFVVGDLIKMNNDELIGFVEEITLRHTIIKTYENNRVIVPNATINKATIENANLIDSLKGNYFIIPVAYDADIDLAQKIISEECTSHPLFVDARSNIDKEKGITPVVVRCVEFGPNALILRVTINSRDSFEGFEMLSDLRFAIKKRFDKEGIDIPYNRTFTPK